MGPTGRLGFGHGSRTIGSDTAAGRVMSRDALRARDAGRETAEVTLLREHRQVYDLYRDGNAVVNAQADLA